MEQSTKCINCVENGKPAYGGKRFWQVPDSTDDVMWNQLSVSGYDSQHFSAFYFLYWYRLTGSVFWDVCSWCLLYLGISFEIIQWAGRTDSKVCIDDEQTGSGNAETYHN